VLVSAQVGSSKHARPTDAALSLFIFGLFEHQQRFQHDTMHPGTEDDQRSQFVQSLVAELRLKLDLMPAGSSAAAAAAAALDLSDLQRRLNTYDFVEVTVAEAAALSKHICSACAGSDGKALLQLRITRTLLDNLDYMTGCSSARAVQKSTGKAADSQQGATVAAAGHSAAELSAFASLAAAVRIVLVRALLQSDDVNVVSQVLSQYEPAQSAVSSTHGADAASEAATDALLQVMTPALLHQAYACNAVLRAAACRFECIEILRASLAASPYKWIMIFTCVFYLLNFHMLIGSLHCRLLRPELTALLLLNLTTMKCTQRTQIRTTLCMKTTL
jgi:hypothetical protein